MRLMKNVTALDIQHATGWLKLYDHFDGDLQRRVKFNSVNPTLINTFMWELLVHIKKFSQHLPERGC